LEERMLIVIGMRME